MKTNLKEDMISLRSVLLKIKKREFQNEELKLIGDKHLEKYPYNKRIKKKEIMDFARENMLFLEDSEENEKFIKNKKYSEVPRKLTVDLMKNILKKYLEELLANKSNEIKQKENERKKLKTETSNERIFKNFDIVFLFEDFLETELEIFAVEALQVNLYFAELKPSLFKEQKIEEESKEIFYEFNDNENKEYFQNLEIIKKKADYGSNLKNCKVIVFEEKVLVDLELKEDYFGYENVLSQIDEFENERKNFLIWKQEKKILNFTFENKNDKKDLLNTYDAYLKDKTDFNMETLFQGISFTLDSSAQKQKEETNLNHFEDYDYKNIVEKIQNKFGFKIKSEEKGEFEDILQRKKISEYLPLFDIDENETLLHLNLFYLEKYLKEKFDNFETNLFDFNVKQELDQSEFKNLVKTLNHKKMEYLIHNNEIDQSQFLIFYEKYDSLGLSQKTWQKPNNFIPTFERWLVSEERKLLDMKNELLYLDEDVFGVPEENITKLKINEKILNYGESRTKEFTNVSVTINENKNSQFISLCNNLQDQKFYLEKLIEVPEEIKKELVDINLNLEDKNKKVKKPQDQKYQPIPSYFELLDFFVEKHNSCKMHFDFEGVHFFGNFSAYFDYEKFENKEYSFFDTFMKNKLGIQNERQFGFGVYIDFEKEHKLHILPDGNIYYIHEKSGNKGKVITHDGYIIEYSQELQKKKTKANPLLPDFEELEPEEEIEDFFENKQKNKKEKNAIPIIKQEEVREEISKKEETLEINDKIIIRNKEGEEHEFIKDRWKSTDKDGRIFINDFKGNSWEEEKLPIMKRSASPIQKYPYSIIREDDMKMIYISSEEKVCIFSDNTQFYSDEQENVHLQKKNELVFVIKDTKKNMSKYLDEDIQNQFESTYCEILLKDNLSLNVLKKKSDNENPFLIMLKNSKEEFWFLNAKGECFNFNKRNVEDFYVNNQDMIFRKKKINLYLGMINQLSYDLKKNEIKFNKTKKKKKKDLEKNEKIILDIVNNFKTRFSEKIQELKTEKVEKKEENNQEDKKQENEQNSERKEIFESAVFTEDMLSGYNKTLLNLRSQNKKECDFGSLEELFKKKLFNPTEKEEVYLELINFYQYLDYNEQLKFFIKESVIKNELCLGLIKVNLNTGEIFTKDKINRDITFSIFNYNKVPEFDFKSALSYLKLNQNDLFLEDISGKIPPDILEDDFIATNFKKYQFLLFEEEYEIKIFWLKEGISYQLFDKKFIEENHYQDLFDEQKNLEIFFKEVNLNKKNKFRRKTVKDIELSQKIDVLEYVNISDEERLFDIPTQRIKVKEVFFAHKKNFDKNQFSERIEKFNDWKQNRVRMENFIGFLPKKNDKKQKSIILDHELFDKRDLIKMADSIVEKKNLPEREQLNQLVIKKLMKNLSISLFEKEKITLGNGSACMNSYSNLNGFKKSFLQLKTQIKKQRKESPTYKYKLKIDVLKKLMDEKNKNKKQIKLKEICSKYIYNYFDSYEGREFIKFFDVPKNNILKSIEEKEIIKSLLNYANQSEKENEINNSTNYISCDNQAPQTVKIIKKDKKDFKIKTISKVKEMEIEKKKLHKIEENKNKEKLEKRKKEFTITGEKRKKMEFVSSLYKTSKPEIEKNQKYIETEVEVDRRIRTCSFSNKIYFNADSTQKLRNHAPHKALLESKDLGKPEDYLKLKKNLMTINEYNDINIEDILIFPGIINFGKMRQNSYYKTEFIIVNKNPFSQRIKIRSPLYCKDIFVVFEQGPIACGLKKKVSVEIDTSNINFGQIKEELTIMTKHFKYTIPIMGYVVDENKENFDVINIKLHQNMFSQNIIQPPDFQYPTKEMKLVKNENKIEKSEIFEVNGTTSKNIPKMYFDENFNLSLTKQTHELNDTPCEENL